MSSDYLREARQVAIRELAQRSVHAVRGIKHLITTSTEQVRRGVDLVGETGQSLHTIVGHVEDINSRVRSIASSAKEQLVGLQEISGAISTIDQTTQRNAAMVEESTAASHALSGEIAALNDLLSHFRMADQLRQQQQFAASRAA